MRKAGKPGESCYVKQMRKAGKPGESCYVCMFVDYAANKHTTVPKKNPRVGLSVQVPLNLEKAILPRARQQKAAGTRPRVLQRERKEAAAAA